MLLAVLFAFVIGAKAQTSVTGNVKDATGEPLIGVTVQVKGQQGGTVTDIDGNFTISAPQGSTLQFSYIGYQTQTVKYTSKPMDITMKEDNATLTRLSL